MYPQNYVKYSIMIDIIWSYAEKTQYDNYKSLLKPCQNTEYIKPDIMKVHIFALIVTTHFAHNINKTQRKSLKPVSRISV